MNLEDYDQDFLIEISNGRGAHYVAQVPGKAVDQIEYDLEEAEAVPDHDEYLAEKVNAERVYANRDLDEFRFRSAPIYDRSEDLEVEVDNDNSDYEPEESDNDEILECDGDQVQYQQYSTWNPLTWHLPQRPK